MATRIRSGCRNCRNYIKNQPERFIQILANYKIRCTAAQNVKASMPCPKYKNISK